MRPGGLSNLPPALLRQAAADPANASVRDALLQAAGEASEGIAVEPSPEAREDEVQRAIRKLLLKRGAKVYWLSQARKTGQTRGVPDLLVFDPFRGLVFIEAKRAGGKARDEQVEFRALCQQHGVQHVLGGLAEVRDFLRAGPMEEVEG